MARKVARCLRKNYKKKVKANVKSEKAAADGANEIASLFKGVGDYEAAKRTVAAAQKSTASAISQQRAKGKHLAAKKAMAAVGGKKKLQNKKNSIKRKTLFGADDDDEEDEDDNMNESDSDADSDNEDGEDDTDGVTAQQQLPDLNSLSTPEQLAKYRSLLRKLHVREKMTLREHVRELEKKKASMRGGKNVAEDLRREKRDLGKYIKQLEEEQKNKHATQTRDVEIRIAQIENSRRDPFLIAAERSKARQRRHNLGAAASDSGIYQSGLANAFVPNVLSGLGGGNNSNDNIGADELQNMFAHLM